jgi:hypothetical protein
MIARASAAVGLSLMVFVACTGGGGPIGGDAGGSSSGSSSSSGTGSSSGTASSSGSSSGSATACSEFTVGATVDPAIGGGLTSQVLVQAVSDFAAVAAKQVTDLTAACKAIAVALDAAQANQTAADAQTDPRGKMDAWCKLAVTALAAAKATAGGTTTVQYAPPVCGLSVQEKASCQGRCVGGGPCDTNANPMVCTGGELSGGVCSGGQLQGGCPVDAKCDGGCDAVVVATASCPVTVVTVTSQGAADPATAAKIEAALESDLPAVLTLNERCRLEAQIAASFAGSTSSVTDIKAACIPPVVKAVGSASQDVQACAASTAALVGAAQ